jgi:hypothetical protein
MFSNIGNLFKKKQEVSKEPENDENQNESENNSKMDNQYSAIFSKVGTMDNSLKQNFAYNQSEMLQKFFEEKLKTWKYLST